jgi:hypothetical protein
VTEGETRHAAGAHIRPGRDAVGAAVRCPDRSYKLSRFWILLILAAVIASAGVVADSTATVIGAMIVAPLMTPILGTTLSTITEDRANLIVKIRVIDPSVG